MVSKKLLIILFLMAIAALASTSLCQESWLTSYEFVGANKPVDDTIFADTDYEVEMVINVPFNLTDKRFSVEIPSSHEPLTPTTPFWEIANDYAGVDEETMKELADRTITFRVFKGELRLKVKFRIPSENIVVYTINAPNGASYHIYDVKDSYVLVSIMFEGNPVGSVTFRLTSSKVYDYETKVKELQSADIPPEYRSIVDAVIDESNRLNEVGLTEYAISIVDSLLSLEFPKPPSPMLTYGLAATSVVLGILTLVGFAMYARARGENAYVKHIVDSALVDIAAVKTSLDKIDTRLAKNLSDIAERLRRIEK